ncbi:MAG TPA: hypothetical protein VK025_04765 [Steroidobacter sp.]|jgi:hypothetical protein|nr:hypothetical protein [Steroidobacteraceae bacterium]HLS80695.1 hypothetical protein [Steroidobacter sp.]
MHGRFTEQLMTVEEAQRLSDPHTSREANEQRRRIWAWQSVAGAMAQTVTDEQIEQMEKCGR